jgi:hypothetical protein
MSNTVKYKLDDFAEAEDCILIGIISSSPDYTVCWHINKQFQINLSRCPDVKLNITKKDKKEATIDLFSEQVENVNKAFNVSEHHVFKFIDEQFYSDYYFITNKGTRLTLEPQLKRVTYFFEINGMKAENAEQIIFDLNAIEPIEMAYLIGKESIINKLQLPV